MSGSFFYALIGVILAVYVNCLPIIHINVTSNSLLGGCMGTLYGCCSDNVSYCMNMNCSSCANTTMNVY